MSVLSPVKLSPTFKDYLWGGERLRTDFHKQSDLVPLAESWELSAHRDGESTVSGGEFDGLSLTAYLEAIGGKKALGTHADRFDYFPVLIKFIDAKKDLSVQVHPDDAYALEHEGEYGKTEMWYVLDCEEGAALYYGFSRDVTKEEYATAIQNGTLTDLLCRVPVRKGDVFFIPAGTVHAIGAGIVICEIQQNSNTTYRVYDYNRRDKDGNLRPLHIEKALAVSSLGRAPERDSLPDATEVRIATSEYFKVTRLRVPGRLPQYISVYSFHALTVTEGSGVLITNEEEIAFRKGDTIFIPAQTAKYVLEGTCELILTQI